MSIWVTLIKVEYLIVQRVFFYSLLSSPRKFENPSQGLIHHYYSYPVMLFLSPEMALNNNIGTCS